MNVATVAVANLQRPPYSSEIRAALAVGEAVNVHVHIGRRPWDRAKTHAPGHRLVIPSGIDVDLEQLDFTGLRGLDVALNTRDADLALARRAAVRIVEHGARLVVLLHPGLEKFSEFFYSECA